MKYKATKYLLGFLLLGPVLLAGCGRTGEPGKSVSQTDTTEVAPADSVAEPNRDTDPEIYQNDIFRKVTVNQIADSTFRVTGEARVAEGQFSWVIEDGHYQLKKGSVQMDDGAPEWKEFSFSVEVKKKDPHTTLHLVLYDSAPKEGTARNELPVVLY